MIHWRIAVECSKKIAQRFTQDLRFQRMISLTPEDDFADLITCSLPKIAWRTPTRQIRRCPIDNSADSQKTIARIPKDDSACSPQTIRKFSHRLSLKFANFHTDFLGSPRIFAQTFTEIRYRLLRKSADSIRNLWHVPYNDFLLHWEVLLCSSSSDVAITTLSFAKNSMPASLVDSFTPSVANSLLACLVYTNALNLTSLGNQTAVGAVLPYIGAHLCSVLNSSNKCHK